MALSETAKLVASLELQDKFSRTADSATRKLGGLEGASARAGRGMGIFGHAVSTALGVGLERAVSSGARLLAGALTGGVTALNELESQTVATNTVLTSTQGISGQTAESVRKLAEKYEDLNATIDDKVIQSGENMLLTFTNIRKEAFEPALEAALNMNEAMGGGPEGLQNTVIQLGKALNDPVKGATALRRVGVTLSAEQQKQIKDLVAQNDLYGAQQIILQELGTEFGGRFAAAGKTAEGQMASLHDKVEDLQKSFAGPLIPVLDKVRAKLIEVLGSPAAQKAAEGLGKAIAGIFTDQNLNRAGGILTGVLDKIATFDFTKIGDGVNKVFGFLGTVPWGAISSGLQITGAATKAVVDAFLSLPKEVQGIAIAALAVNKVSGGVAGQLAGGLIGKAIDLFKGRGATPVTPLFVKDVGVGLGGGGGVPGAKGGGGVASLIPIAAAVVAGLQLGNVATAGQTAGVKRQESGQIQAVLDSKDAASIAQALGAIESQLDTSDVPSQIVQALDWNGVRSTLEGQRQALLDQLTAMGLTRTQAEALLAAQQATTAAQEKTRSDAMRADARARTQGYAQLASEAQTRGRINAAASYDQALLSTARTHTPLLRGQISKTEELKGVARDRLNNLASRYSDIGGVTNSRLSGILAKKSSVTVNATIPVSVNISAVQVAYNLSHLRQTTNSGGFI